jgi:hypothetical protein
MAASLEHGWLSCQLTRVLHGWLWQEDLNAGSWRVFLGRSRCQKTTSGLCNRLKTLVCVCVCVCVCQWSVKCNSKWCIKVVNKSSIQSMTRVQSHKQIRDNTFRFTPTPSLPSMAWDNKECSRSSGECNLLKGCRLILTTYRTRIDYHCFALYQDGIFKLATKDFFITTNKFV